MSKVKNLDKKNVEKLESLPSPRYMIISMLKKTGMKHNEAKLWASNFEYPHVADDIVGMIGHMLSRRDKYNARKTQEQS